MERALRQTIVVGPLGRVEIPQSDLLPGTTAEIIVLPIGETKDDTSLSKSRAATLSRMQELRNQAVEEGMELWDAERINAEVTRLRGESRRSV
jgi:hypothetical protein